MSRTKLPEPTMLDKVITWASPELGANRLRARMALQALGGYSGASRRKRTLSKYNASNGSAAADLLPDLPTLRERSRDLERNNPIAGGAINTVVTKTVGTGLALKCAVNREVLGWDEEKTRKWQRKTEALFRSYAESTAPDICREQNFYGLQDLAWRSVLSSGDVFSLLVHKDRPGQRYSACQQLIEADRVCNPQRRSDTEKLTAGIERDDDGAPLKAHILRSHPGALGVKDMHWDEREFFTGTGKRALLHLYRKRRVGQPRGVPYLAPVIEKLKQLDRYTDAELEAAVVSAFFAVFIKKPGGSGMSPLASAATGETPNGSDKRQGGWDGTLTGGIVAELDDGCEVDTATPGRPNQAFDPFVLAMLRQVGIALELPYEVLIKHFTASYTAARAAVMEAWQFVRGCREFLANEYCQPIYEHWLEEAVALGDVEAPGFFKDPLLRWAYCGSIWVGDGPGTVDPLKDANAAEKRLSIGISTRAKESMLYDGSDWEENHEQLALENKRRVEDGLGPLKESKADPDPNDQSDPKNNPDLPERN
jgi:lambda family phage portal protein